MPEEILVDGSPNQVMFVAHAEARVITLMTAWWLTNVRNTENAVVNADHLKKLLVRDSPSSSTTAD